METFSIPPSAYRCTFTINYGYTITLRVKITNFIPVSSSCFVKTP